MLCPICKSPKIVEFVINVLRCDDCHTLFKTNPKNIGEYKKILLNLGSISNKISKKEIYEFYGMHHLIDHNFFEDFNMNVQNTHEHQSFNIYTRFVRKIRQNKIKLKIDIYKNFIRNKKIRRLVKI